MAAPPPSRLDANQVLQGSFDESTGRLRTDANATVVNADIDVALDATEDSVEAWIVDEAGNAFSNANPLPISDAGGSLTVDGTVELGATTLAALESITVQNGAGVSAVNIQDGGNSITVDGVVTATQGGTWNITNVTGTVSLPTGASTAALQTTGNTTLTNINNKLANNYGAATTALRTASQIGNTIGAADFGVGAITAQTLRTASNTLATDPNGVVTTNKESGLVDSNSSVTPLLAGQIFTGAWVDASQYSCISWCINSDVDSATNGLKLQFSHDGAIITRQSNVSFTGSANGVFFSFPVHAKYFRIVYENGAVNQTRFILDTQLHEEYNGLAAIPLDIALSDKSSATTVKSVIAGKSVDGIYVNQRADGVSTLNSTSVLLGSGATYTGTWEDIVGYANISIICFSDVDSAVDGLKLEYSSDGINIDDFDSFGITGGNGNQISSGATCKYFRVTYTNGASPQTQFRLQTVYHITAPKPSTHRIDDSINGQNDAELMKAVLTGKNPDNNFSNVRVQGVDTENSSYTPLNANAIFRGEWFKWSESYLTLISTVSSDVSGTIYIDASDVPNPTNGVDTDITYSAASFFDPSEVSALRRNTPVQSLWIRHRYINGPAAQTFFNLAAMFTVQDPGAVYLPANQVPANESLAAITRSISTIPNAAADGYQDVPVDSLTGDPKVTIQTIRDDLLFKPMNSVQVEQGVISTVPARIDPSPLFNRRKVIISNDGTSNCSIGFSSSISYNSASFVLKGGKERELELDSSVELWAVAEDTGGVTSVLDRTGTTTGGTAANSGNTLLSDNLYANITANGQTATVTGYTAGTANPLVSVKLGVEGAKQASQFETVTFVDVVTGSAGNTGTVSSGIVTANSTHTYLVSVSWGQTASNITTVVGMGATWVLVAAEQTGTLDGATAVYRNSTPVIGNDSITISFSAVTGGSVVAVSRYSGVNTSAPIQVFESINSPTGVTSYSDSIIGTNKGMLVTSVTIKGQSHTAGSGATERTEVHQAANAGIAVNTLSLTSTGAQAYSGTFGGNVKYGVIALTLAPADAINPRIVLSYELSAIPGATSGLIEFSSSSDGIAIVDVTGDRAWVIADIPNIKVIATGSLISAAAVNVDQLFLQLTDTTGNTTRVSILQTGRSF